MTYINIKVCRIMTDFFFFIFSLYTIFMFTDSEHSTEECFNECGYSPPHITKITCAATQVWKKVLNSTAQKLASELFAEKEKRKFIGQKYRRKSQRIMKIKRRRPNQ